MTAAPLLLHVFPSFAVGGAQVRFAALANRHGARWRHAIVALDGQTGCAARLGPGIAFDLLPAPFARGDAAPQRLRRIAALLQHLDPAVLVTSNWGSMDWVLANRMIGRRPNLHTEDGFGPEESAAQFPRRILARRLLLRASTVVLPSATLLQVARKVWRLPEAALHYIPNGLDLRRFRPGDGAEPGAGPLVGTVAALRPEKNLGRLLQAVAILRAEGTALRLRVVGDGPERERLEALSESLGLAASVQFAGAIADPAAAYRGMDLFCLSSDTEQMPFSVLEAMATGLAIAATDVGDIASMVAVENRPYLAPRDPAALADMLRPLLRDAGLRAGIGAANRRRAERDFDQEAMFAAYAGLIDGMATRFCVT